MLRTLVLVTMLILHTYTFANEPLITQINEFAKEVNAKLQEQDLVSNQLYAHQEKNNKPQIFIFISFSMSETSIKEWAVQADRFGAKLVLRGFVDNSFKATVIAAHRLFAKDNLGGFIIDPFAFEKYQIKTVPAVVLDMNNKFDVVFGNVGLTEALKIIQKQGENSRYAQEYLSHI